MTTGSVREGAATGGTGLYNFRARWYDPVTSRWLSNDPVGISGGLNQYAFCANNPVMFVDHFGLYGNVISGGGTEVYYPRGGWSSSNISTTTYEHRSSSILREAAPVVAVGVVGSAALVTAYYAAPYVVGGVVYVCVQGQNVFYRILSWQPMSYFIDNALILWGPQGAPARSSVGEIASRITPTTIFWFNDYFMPGPSISGTAKEIRDGSPNAIWQKPICE